MAVQFPLDPDSVPMGANVVPDRSGVTFRVRAPRAKKVWVRGTFNDWAADDSTLLHRHGEDWIGYVDGVKQGARYKFYVQGHLPDPEWKRDPWARELTKEPPHPRSECIVHRPDSFPWHDDGYQPPYFHDLIIYQLHVGTFNGPDRESRVAKFLDVLGKLDYLAALGVNALLFLPIVEFSSARSLGYEGADIFSPEQDYCLDEIEAGSYVPMVNDLRNRAGLANVDAAFLGVMSHQLKVVVELCHKRGIAVLFDVVYNHVNKDIPGPHGVESIWNFEQWQMHHDHESYLWSDQDHNGPCWDIDWKKHCRQYLIDNATFFLREYHIDGFRYDETTEIIEKNPARGWQWCQNLTSTVRFVKPQAVEIAEHWPPGGPDPWVVGTEWGHAGFDVCYHDGLRRAIRDALRQASYGMTAPVEIDRIAGFLWPAGFSEAWRCLQHVENHDLVHVKEEDRIPQLAAPGQTRTWWAVSRSRVASGLLLTAPGIPMLFMGQEFLEDKRWSDDPEHSPGSLLWWHGLDSGQDRAMVNFHRFMEELIRLRLNQPALRGDRLNILHCWNPTRVLAFYRWIEGTGQDVVVVASLNDHTFPAYDLPWPSGGRWREIFNSDAYDDYQPTGNGGSVEAQWNPRDSMPASARLTIPANSLLLFCR
jgi:1,4-alpha-glucan branching enzyme